MVHGLNGTKNDLRNLDTKFIYAEENQYKTDQSIKVQGDRLYQEVCLYVLQLKKDEDQMKDIKVSFIAHSLGGLVVREALRQLQNHEFQFQTFLTISSPHLGVDSNNPIFKFGYFLTKAFKKDSSLRQITRYDSDQYINELCDSKHLNKFRTLVLIYIHEDNQVNYESSKIIDKGQSEKVKQYVRNFYKDIYQKEIMKIGIFMPKFTKGLDKLLKLKVHTQTFTNKLLMQFWIHHVKHLFH